MPSTLKSYLSGEMNGRQSTRMTAISPYRKAATAVHWKVIVPAGLRRKERLRRVRQPPRGPGCLALGRGVLKGNISK